MHRLLGAITTTTTTGGSELDWLSGFSILKPLLPATTGFLTTQIRMTSPRLVVAQAILIEPAMARNKWHLMMRFQSRHQGRGDWGCRWWWALSYPELKIGGQRWSNLGQFAPSCLHFPRTDPQKSQFGLPPFLPSLDGRDPRLFKPQIGPVGRATAGCQFNGLRGTLPILSWALHCRCLELSDESSVWGRQLLCCSQGWGLASPYLEERERQTCHQHPEFPAGRSRWWRQRAQGRRGSYLPLPFLPVHKIIGNWQCSSSVCVCVRAHARTQSKSESELCCTGEFQVPQLS